MSAIESLESLRALYKPASERSLKKQLDHLDVHCRRFIALSPFLVMASANGDGQLDASPRGGASGFAKTPDERTIIFADAPGNNRLDSLSNLTANPNVGLLFVVPGVDESLRINGTASLSTDAAWLDLCTDERRRPALVIAITVRDAYLHCAKAFMRSKLWEAGSWPARSALPTMGEMLRDQIGTSELPESQEAMAARYQKDL